MLIKGCPPYLYCTIHSFLSIFFVKIRLGTPGYGWEDLLPPSKLEIRLDTPKRYAWDFWRFLAIFFQKGTHGHPYYSWKFLRPPLKNFQMYPAVPFSPPRENFVSTCMVLTICKPSVNVSYGIWTCWVEFFSKINQRTSMFIT